MRQDQVLGLEYFCVDCIQPILFKPLDPGLIDGRRDLGSSLNDVSLE